MQEQSPLIDTDVYEVLGAKKVVESYQSPGAGGLKQLQSQLARWNKLLRKDAT
jgi:argininosuccinate lyase